MNIFRKRPSLLNNVLNTREKINDKEIRNRI